MTRDASIGLRVDPRLKEAAAKAAEADSRTLASLTEFALKRLLEERGYWPPKDEA